MLLAPANGTEVGHLPVQTSKLEQAAPADLCNKADWTSRNYLKWATSAKQTPVNNSMLA
jgi:hypothetical protein